METRKGQVAALGRKEDILPFRSTGVAIYITEDIEEAGRIFASLVKEGFALILVTEDLWAGMGAEGRRCMRSYLPAVTVIPGKDGTSRIARDMLYDEVRKAIGINIRKDSKR